MTGCYRTQVGKNYEKQHTCLCNIFIAKSSNHARDSYKRPLLPVLQLRHAAIVLALSLKPAQFHFNKAGRRKNRCWRQRSRWLVAMQQDRRVPTPSNACTAAWADSSHWLLWYWLLLRKVICCCCCWFLGRQRHREPGTRLPTRSCMGHYRRAAVAGTHVAGGPLHEHGVKVKRGLDRTGSYPESFRHLQW